LRLWFNSLSAIKVPLQDLTFIKNLLQYTTIDKDLSQIPVKKFCGHLWYLSTDLCAFAFIDKAVPLKIKKKWFINNDGTSSELTSNTQRLVISLENANEWLEKEINDFICVNTKKLFVRFAINTNFSNEDSLNWGCNEDYHKALLI